MCVHTSVCFFLFSRVVRDAPATGNIPIVSFSSLKKKSAFDFFFFKFRIEKSWERPWFNPRSHPQAFHARYMSVVFKIFQNARSALIVDGDERNWATPIELSHQLDNSVYTFVYVKRSAHQTIWTEMRWKLNLLKNAVNVYPSVWISLTLNFLAGAKDITRDFFPTRISIASQWQRGEKKVSAVWDEIEKLAEISVNASWSSLSIRHKRIAIGIRNWVHWCNNSIYI